MLHAIQHRYLPMAGLLMPAHMAVASLTGWCNTAWGRAPVSKPAQAGTCQAHNIMIVHLLPHVPTQHERVTCEHISPGGTSQAQEAALKLRLHTAATRQLRRPRLAGPGCLHVFFKVSACPQESRLEPRGSDASALGRQMSGMQVNDLLGLGSEPGSARSPATDDPFQVGPVLMPSPCSRQGSPKVALGTCSGPTAVGLPWQQARQPT